MAKILIAEDEITCRMIVAKAVEQLGHCAINSPDGRHAWETICANPDIAMLITDVKMPGLDGRELITRMRQHEPAAHIPVVIISGVVGPKAIAQFLEQGATWFVAKPVDARELQEYIRQSVSS